MVLSFYSLFFFLIPSRCNKVVFRKLLASAISYFVEIVKSYSLAVAVNCNNYFCKTHHLRCLTGCLICFWIRQKKKFLCDTSDHSVVKISADINANKPRRFLGLYNYLKKWLPEAAIQKKDALKNFAEFIGKHQYRSLFLKKVGTGVLQLILRNIKEKTFFVKHHRVTASTLR